MVEGVKVHPDMRIIQEAQKTAYAGATVEEQRHSWSRYTAALAAPRPADMRIEDRAVTAGNRAIPIRVYRHAAATGHDACILYMHGGGFMKGDLDSSDPVAWGFCAETGATVISVDYRLTPEHPHPAALEDCQAVLHDVAAHATDYGIDPARIALAGDSAGGHLAIALCLAAREEGPAIAAHAVIYSCTGSDLTAESFRQNATGFGLTTSAMDAYMKLLLGPDWRKVTSPIARPALATRLTGMPPAFVHTAGLDPLRDEGRDYAARLALAGVDVTYREAAGMIHGFMRARFTGAAARVEYQAICDFLRARLASVSAPAPA